MGVQFMGIQIPDVSTLPAAWQILIIDDDEEDFILAREMLKQAKERSYAVHWAASFEAGRAAVFADPFSAVLVDYDLGPHSGIELIREANERGYAAPLILFTGRGSYEIDVEAIQAGATLYLTKGEVTPRLLERSIRYAIEQKKIENSLRISEAQLRASNQRLTHELAERQRVEVELRKTSEALSENEQKFFLQFDKAAYTAALAKLPEGILVDVNEAFEKAFGYTRQEVVGKTSRELNINPDQETRARILALLQEGGFVRDQEITLRTKSGEWRTFMQNIDLIDIGQEKYILTTMIDITVRKQNEELLRYHASLVENMSEAAISTGQKRVERHLAEQTMKQEIVPEALFAMDEQFRITTWNCAASEIYGFSAEEAIGQVVGQLLQIEITEEQWARQKQQLAETGHCTIEQAHFTKDGKRIIIEASTILIRDTNGKMTGYVSSHRDITARKRAEAALRANAAALRESAALLEKRIDALRKSEEMFSLSFRSSPLAGSISTLAEGRLMEVNDRYIAMFGFSREELIGHTTIELGIFPNLDARQKIVRQYRYGGVRNFETQLIMKSGEPRDVLFSSEPIDIDGQDCVLSLVVDITERKQADQALRASENRLRKLVEGNIIGVGIRDAAGRLRDANTVFLRMIGYSCDDVQAGQLSIKDLTPPEFWPVDQQAVAEALATGSCQPYEKAYLHKDGRVVPCMVGYTRLDETSDDLIGFVLDLTEIIKARIKLQEYAEKLTQSNQELEQFAFVASHDLQEPLRKIKQFGKAIQQNLEGKLEKETQDNFQRMMNASERMQVMIKDLLDLSRVNRQGQPFVPVDLSAVAAEVVSDLEPRILRTSGQVVVEALPTIEADPIQIEQVLQNLIGNGLKFHKPGTQPLVKVSSSILRSPNHPGEMVSIQVEDNGIGFDEQQFETILQPFQRLHGRSEFEGTGIGLAIVKKIIDRHHGEISAHSTPGVGSTFIVTLPMKQTG
jgi:PAS domain S-box-containing protein